MFFCCVLHLRSDRSVRLIRFALKTLSRTVAEEETSGYCLVNQLNRAFLAFSQRKIPLRLDFGVFAFSDLLEYKPFRVITLMEFS